MKLNIFRNVEVELPVFNKVLFCIPLRPGLIIWGFIQLLATFAVQWCAIIEFMERSQNKNGSDLVKLVVFFMITMIASLFEAMNCLFLVFGAQMKNTNFLGVSYDYLKFKIPAYGVFFIVSFVFKTMVYSDKWYNYMDNLDSWSYMVLMDNLALGVLIEAVQFYLLLLVRSEILKLKHNITITTLYERIYPSQIPADSLNSKPKLDVI